MSTCSGIANLNDAFAMLKHRKRILLAALLLVFALGLALFLRPRNEPRYQGRYLSEWMQVFTVQDPDPDQLEAAKRAVQKIGTNAVPIFVAWMHSETPKWKHSLRWKLPPSIVQDDHIASWLGGYDVRRLGLGAHGLWILGTNAATAIPELNNMMQNRTNTMLAHQAIYALTGIGGDSIPVMQAAFSDPQFPYRLTILWNLRSLAFSGHTNECMPIIIGALEDWDARVRSKATNFLQVPTYREFINNLPRD